MESERVTHRGRRAYCLSMRFYEAAGDIIDSFESWKSFGLLPSRAARHWKEGRSACELARAWTSSGMLDMPREMTAYLESQASFEGFRPLSGGVERETHLPFVKAGPRCHDLVLVGQACQRTVLISVEAKADEEFDKSAEIKLREALKKPRTTFPHRLEWLTTSLLALKCFPEDNLNLDPPARWLPYQLLSGIAGALLEAEAAHASTAIFLIHEFKTTLTKDLNHLRNSITLSRFVSLMCQANGISPLELDIERKMLGPIVFEHVPTARRRPAPPQLPLLPLYIGKIVSDRR